MKLKFRLGPDAATAKESAQQVCGEVEVDGESTVRQVSASVERVLLSQQRRVANCAALFLPLKLDRALPFPDPISKYAQDNDTLVILGDSAPAPAHLTVESSGQSEAVGAKKSTIPVTILTGFLGSGKTTLLNHLLREQRHRKIAVIENEFGAVPLDNEILGNTSSNRMAMAEQVVVLENGCMCCQVRGDILGAFEQIGNNIANGNQVDAVVVETTGIADPVPIVRTFLRTPAIVKHFHLDGVVTMVDVKHFVERLGDGLKAVKEQQTTGVAQTQLESGVNEAFQQVMFADKIVLNKLDLVPPAEVEQVLSRVREINSTVRVDGSVRGQLHPDQLVGLNAFDMRDVDIEREFLAEEENEAARGCGDSCSHSHSHGHGHSHGHSHDHHEDGSHSVGSRHVTNTTTFSITEENMEILPLEFARWLRVLATLPPEAGQLFRAKGIFAAKGYKQKLLFHAVGDVMEKQFMNHWGGGETKTCRVVFIGKDLNRELLEQGYRACLVPINSVSRRLNMGPCQTQSSATTSTVGRGLLSRLTRKLSPSSHKQENGSESNSRAKLSNLDTTQIWQILGFLSTKDAGSLGIVSTNLYESIMCHAPAETGLAQFPQGFQPGGKTMKGLYLHTIAPLSVVRSYVASFKKSAPEVVSLMGMQFTNFGELEALGITLLEAAEKSDNDTAMFLLDFKWRSETVAQFLSEPGKSTSSALCKVEYNVDDPDAFDEICDTLKFRAQMIPGTSADTLPGAAPTAAADAVSTPSSETSELKQGGDDALVGHRVGMQIVGGKSTSQVYMVSFHTISPDYQLHIPVPDHRAPLTVAKELLHKWHPLWEDMKSVNRVRFLVRVKPDGSGPLEDMCGCC